MNKQKQQGFTLAELIIVLAILAILAAIGIPAYHHHIIRDRRSDGQVALLDLAARLERYYVENHTFATATIGGNNPATQVLATNKSPRGYYTLSIITQSPGTFIIQAAPNGTQATDDKACGSLRINEMGTKSITGTGSIDDCWKEM